MEWKKIISGMMALGILLTALFVPVGVSEGADDTDYSNTWELPADGSNDTTKYYHVVRDNTSKSGEIYIKGWLSNRTALIHFDNIAEVDLYLNETDFDPKEFVSSLSLLDTEVTLLLRSATSTTIDFDIHSVPEFEEISLDGDDFKDYTHSNDILSFKLSMSDHEISILIDGIMEELITNFIVIFWLLVTVKLIVSQFNEMSEEL